MDSRSFSDIRHADDAGQGFSSSTVQPAGADRTERFGFLRLPLELRIQIYENIFSDSADTDYSNAKSPFGNTVRDRIRARVQPPKHLLVAMTSKQIYREALPILYKTYHFRLSMWEDDTLDPYAKKKEIKRFLAQLRRPLALLMLPSISYLDLFVELEVGGGGERVSSVFQVINHVCVGLQTFCLYTDQVPRSWIRAAKALVAENEEEVEDFEHEPVESLRGLANRVRVFKIDVWYFHFCPDHRYLVEALIPGSTVVVELE
ncbi:MAG: hypothetical protein OHK93_005323 [Ramalina farinacea]|uniref:Uncharacterized protein n=1 Tax=Ramalina farinacea TaxID=258253 RepID=A0AA43TZA4_9LECA|nr:hypothetical protein [Ramalina farinacea]